MKKAIRVILFAVLVLICIVLINVFRLKSKQMNVPLGEKISLDKEKAVGKLSNAIKFKTITNSGDSVFVGFHNYLKANLPIVFSQLELMNCANCNSSLILKWKGKNNALKPILLLAHQDVVPIDDSTKWTFPPFEGKSDNEFIFGRGTLDVKCSILGILEAVELLANKGFEPERAIYFAFGHDEETGGENGAKKIANWFSQNKIKFESILDEGGSIVHDIIPGVKSPVALIGIAEKGYATLNLSVEDEGGHSSMPPPHTSAGIISDAVTKLEQNPFKPKLKGATKLMFEYLAPEMDFGSKIAFANTWLMEGIILNKMSKKNSTNAATRTTTAVTMLNAGTKENVLPVNASATINFRILSGETSNDVLKHATSVINDERVKISFVANPQEPSAVSDVSSVSFNILNKTIRQTFSGTLVSPYMVLATTDSKHYAALSKNIFRFLPIQLGPEDLKRIHGTDERIGKENYLDMIRFYKNYLENASAENQAESK